MLVQRSKVFNAANGLCLATVADKRKLALGLDRVLPVTSLVAAQVLLEVAEQVGMVREGSGLPGLAIIKRTVFDGLHFQRCFIANNYLIQSQQ